MPHELTVDQENSPTDYPEDSSLAPRSRSFSNASEDHLRQKPAKLPVPHLMADTPKKVVHHHDDDDDSGASSSSDEHSGTTQNGTGE